MAVRSDNGIVRQGSDLPGSPEESSRQFMVEEREEYRETTDVISRPRQFSRGRSGRRVELSGIDEEESMFSRRPFSISRENSFLVNRDRTKSMESGILRQFHNQNVLYHKSSIARDFQPPYNLLSKVVKKLDKIRKDREEKEKEEVKGKVWEEKARIIVDSIFFKVFIFLVVIIHAGLLCFYQPEVQSDLHSLNDTIHRVTIGFVVIYCIEAVLNIMAFGFILKHNVSYLRRADFLLDLVVIIFGILYLSLRYSLLVIAEVLSTLMVLKLIKILARFKSVRFMLKALAKSGPPLFYLSVLTFVVIIFFALLGIEFFLGRLHGGCYANYTTPAGTFRRVLVSEFPCHYENESDFVSISGDHICPYNSQCLYWDKGPVQGVVSFDSIFRAFLIVFQSITLEGWSRVFYLFQASVGQTFAWAYFLLVIFIGSVFILNLFFGVLTIVFINVSEREQKTGNSHRLKEKIKIEKDLANYKHWLIRGAELQHPSDTESIERYDMDLPTPHEKEEDTSDKEETDIKNEHNNKNTWCDCYKRSSEKLENKVLKSSVWFWFIIMAHVINLGLLMSFHFPSDPQFDETIFILNYFFSVLFVVDLILQIYGQGPLKFFLKKESFFHVTSRLLEFLLGILSILSLTVFIFISPLKEWQIPVIVNAIWSTKIVLLGKISKKNWKNVKEVLKTLDQSSEAILSLMALIGVFLLIFTISGLRMFGNKLSIIRNVQPNFDDFFNSFLLVFQLLTTEDWHNVLYSSVGSLIFHNSTYGYITSLYFLVAIILGAFILVSVFLALAVDNLSEVRDLEEEKEVDENLALNERKKRNEQINALKDSKPEIRRRTIRHLLQFESHNPAERSRALKEGGKSRKWWKQISLPQFRQDSQKIDFHRSISSPPHSSISRTRTDGRKMSIIEEEKTPDDVFSTSPKSLTSNQGTIKRTNPLSYVRGSSEYFDTRFDVDASENSSHVASSGKMNSKKKPKTDLDKMEESVFHSNIRQMSVMSSPGVMVTSKRNQSKVAEFQQRSHSLPVGGLSTEVVSACNVVALGAIKEEGDLDSWSGSTAIELPVRRHSGMLSRQDSIHDSIDLDFPSSQAISPSQSSLEDKAAFDLSNRYTRGSSLEPVRYSFSNNSPKPTKEKESKMKKNVMKIFDWMKEYFGTIQLDPNKELDKIPPHSAFFIIDHENRFRELCFKLVKSRSFQTITYAAIFLSSVLLMLEVPNGVRRCMQRDFCAFQQTIIWIDLGIVIFFLIEVLLKMISLGVIVHRDSYLRGLFNFVDFVVTISSLIPILVYFLRIDQRSNDICISYGYDEALPPSIGILRVLRVLRPLRAIRISGLYLVVTGIFSSFKAMFTVLFFDALIIVIFAVIGVHLFRGTFFYCTDPEIQTEEECIGYYFKYDYSPDLNLTVPGLSCPIAEERVWTQYDLNFDHIGHASLSLFTMLTAEGWQNIMYNGVNSRRPLDTRTPLASIVDNSKYLSLYFILYMIIMTFIMLQLFVGFVIVTFQEIGVKSFRDTKLDRNQRNCLYFALTTRPIHQYVPRHKPQRRFREFALPIVDSTCFKTLIGAVLLFNTVLLCFQHYGWTYKYDGSREYSDGVIVIYYLNAACTFFFVFEALIKLVVLTPPIYFRNLWNTFSFLIVLGSVIEFIVQRSGMTGVPYSHIASTFRVLRLLQFIPRVKRILWTIIRSLKIFPWVGYLLVIIVFTYSIVGMHLFGTIEPVSIEESDSKGIHRYNNFKHFANALVLMVRVITGENWQDVMVNSLGGQKCYNPEHTNCGSNFAYIFYPSFYFISTIMILNLFVAVIMDNFEYVVRDKCILGAYDLLTFVHLWAKTDKQAKGKLKPEEVFDMLRKINPPVGWGKLCPRMTAYKKMIRLNIPLVSDKSEEGVKMITFNATLFALVRSSLKIDCQGCANCKTTCNKVLKAKLKILFPTMNSSRIDEVLASETDETVAAEYAALIVQAKWRAFMLRKRTMMDIFYSSKGKVLKANREIPDAGPDLILSRRISNFENDLEMFDIPAIHRKVSESSSDKSRLGSKSPHSPFSPPLPVKEPDGCEGLWGPSSPTSNKQCTSPNFLATSESITERRVNAIPDSITEQRVSVVMESDERFFGKQRSEGDDDSYTSAQSNPSPKEKKETPV